MATAGDTISADAYFQDFDFDGEICWAWLSRKSKFRDGFNEEGNRKALCILHQLVDLRNTRKFAWAKESEKLKEKLARLCGAEKAEAFINAHDAEEDRDPDLFRSLDHLIKQGVTHGFDDHIFDAPDNGFQASPGPLPSLPSPKSTTPSPNTYNLGAPVAQMDLFEYPPTTTKDSTTGVQLGTPITEVTSHHLNASAHHQQPPATGQHQSYNTPNVPSEITVSLIPSDTLS